MSSQDENWRPIQQKGARAAAPLAGEAGRGPGEKEKGGIILWVGWCAGR